MPTYYDPETGQPVSAGVVYYDPDTGQPIQQDSSLPPISSGKASATVGALRAAPRVGQSIARFAANHPAATQKVIGAGATALASSAGAGVGALIGGAPGAMVGAVTGGAVRGMTPSQAVIRETAGRLAGEAPAVARDAARNLGIQNYAKETAGIRVKSSDIINKPNPTNAVTKYANSMEKDILRIYDPHSNVVSGPSAVTRTPAPARPGVIARTAGAVSKVLNPLSAGMGITDFMQTIEPNRRDIGVMGVGASQPDPTGAELEQIDAHNKAAMSARLQDQKSQRAALIQRILQTVGLR